MADKSPRQHQSKKSGKSLKEKRTDKKTKQATKRTSSLDELEAATRGVLADLGKASPAPAEKTP